MCLQIVHRDFANIVCQLPVHFYFMCSSCFTLFFVLLMRKYLEINMSVLLKHLEYGVNVIYQQKPGGAGYCKGMCSHTFLFKHAAEILIFFLTGCLFCIYCYQTPDRSVWSLSYQ